MSTLNERIREVYQKNASSQQKFAEVIGVSTRTLSEYLAGRTGPSLDVFVRMANSYNISLDWLILGVGYMYRATPSQVVADTVIGNNSQQVNDTTLLDFSHGKQVQNVNGAATDDERRRLVAQVMSQQDLLRTLQNAIDRLTATNHALTNKLLGI